MEGLSEGSPPAGRFLRLWFPEMPSQKQSPSRSGERAGAIDVRPCGRGGRNGDGGRGRVAVRRLKNCGLTNWFRRTIRNKMIRFE